MNKDMLDRTTGIAQTNHGFTLIEIMIAITVFSIGILAINIMQTSTITGNSAANLLSGRTNWASDQLEKIISWDYTNANLTDDGNDTTIDGSTNSPDSVYTISWKVADNTPVIDTKTVTVTVTDSILSRNTVIALIKAKVL